jgi:hypothetical protein
MENELVPNPESGPLVPIVENPYSEMDFDEVSGTRFLPRLQLFIAKSGAVSEGKIAMNHFGLVTFKDSITDLGLETNILVINWRPRALDTSDRSNIRSSFQPQSELFQEIKAQSAQPNSGCQYGPEYLIWVFQTEQFATFFMGGATTRNEAKMFHQLLTKVATLKSRLIKTEKFTWQSPFAVPCSKNDFTFPTPGKIIETQQEFLNPAEQTGMERVEAKVVDR